MPTYEYKCERCGKFEQWQSITDDPLASCPTCGGPVNRLISNNVNIIFKGSGFYVTDNRSAEYEKAAKAESGSRALQLRTIDFRRRCREFRAGDPQRLLVKTRRPSQSWGRFYFQCAGTKRPS